LMMSRIGVVKRFWKLFRLPGLRKWIDFCSVIANSLNYEGKMVLFS
jgi:hypothetical protein